MTTKQSPIPRFYTVEEVAERLGVTGKSIRRWIDQGVLPFHKFQGRLRISEEDLLAYVSSCRR
jgi:excisionase family DNA binding protein